MQNEKKNTICKLCLISCEGDYQDVEPVTIELLKSVGLVLDISIGEKPVLCRICSEGLQKCFDFKTVCVCTEDCINSFRSSGSNTKLNLTEIYFRKKESENIIVSKYHNICRICMEVAEWGSYMALNDEAKDVVLAKTILMICFTELDLDITKNPIICTNCIKSLHNYFSFIKNCLHTTNKKYDENERSSSNLQVESDCVLQIGTENKSLCKDDDADTDMQENLNENELYDEIKLKLGHLQNGSQELHIKREVDESEESNDNAVEKLNSPLQITATKKLYCENGYIDTNVFRICNENEQNGETELKCENFVVAESHKFNVKHEEIDIKMEDEDITRYQDIVLTPKDASVKTYQCDTCTFCTRYKRSLKNHMFIHKGISEKTPALSCGICTYKTIQPGNFKRHMLVHRSPSEITMYSCEKCTLKTKHQSYLKTHMLIHTSELNTYSCGKCTYETVFKSSLNRHMLVHKREGILYKCDLCEFESRYKCGLKMHSLVHQNASEVTKYYCGLCTYKTKQEDDLKEHVMLNHEDATKSSSDEPILVPCEEPNKNKNASEVTKYYCEICTYKTKQKDDLKEHIKLNHEDATESSSDEPILVPCKEPNKNKNASEVTQYYCEICTYKTKQKDDLKEHIMLNHEDATENSCEQPIPCEEPILYVPPIVIYIN